MGRQFDVDYDDFSGGYWTGGRANQQPMNTWEGNDVQVSPSTGYLVAATSMETSSFSPVVSAPLGMVTDGANFYWSKGTTGYNAAWTDLAPVATAHAGTTADTTHRTMVLFNGARVESSYTIARVLVNNVFAATPVILGDLGRYKYWVVGAGTVSPNANRVYFCAPNDPSSWPAANFFDVGPPGEAITGFVDGLDALYVQTTGGLYAVTGVLGSSTTVRQINQEFMNEPTLWANAINGVTVAPYTSANQLPAVAQGSLVRKYLYPAVSIQYIYRAGPAIIMIDSANRLWVNDPTTTGAWFMRSIGFGIAPVQLSYGDDYGYVIVFPGAAFASLQRFAINPTTSEPNPAGGAFAGFFPGAAVTLADYQAKRPFRVTEVQVEVQTGVSTNTTDRSFGCKVLATSVPSDGLASGPHPYASNASTEQTYRFTTATGGARIVHRFKVSDAGPTYAAAPYLTLRGVDIVRVIMRCEEI